MLCFPNIGDDGRLGNAMFQYAALLGIANKTGYVPWYDSTKTGKNCTLHNVFNLSGFEDVLQWKQISELKRVWKEPHFHFCEDAFSVKEGTGLHGYLQSEKYFKHSEDTVHSQFEFFEELKKDCEEKIKGLKQQIDDSSIVSVHIRLGDYKILEHVFFPLIKTKYYTDAMATISEKTDNKHAIMIFSDELDVCKQIFKGNNIAFAEGGTPEQDMCLMSMCDHNIIANSSFSWWAAWLNKNKDKTIVAPKQWFIPDEKNPKDTKDLYCDGWELI